MMEKIDSTKIYSITSEFKDTPAEFNTIENALAKSRFLAIKEVHGSTPRLSGDVTYHNPFTNYEFYFAIGNEVLNHWELNGWMMKYEGRAPSGIYDQNGIKVSFTDPFGQIEYFKDSDLVVKKHLEGYRYPNTRIEERVYPVLRLFRKFAQERDLRTALLLTEVEDLKREIEVLKKTIDDISK